MDPLAESIISSAFQHALYTLSFVVGAALLIVSLFCMFVASVTDRGAEFGHALMMGGAGLVAPSLFQMLIVLFEAGAEVPMWLPLSVNVVFPIVGCGFAIYGLCQYKREKRNQAEAVN